MTAARSWAGVKAFFAKILQPLQEQDGLLSMRRCMGAYFAVMSTLHFYWAYPYSDKGWPVFIPGLACIAAALLLLFFTTWSDVTEALRAARGLKNPNQGVTG